MSQPLGTREVSWARERGPKASPEVGGGETGKEAPWGHVAQVAAGGGWFEEGHMGQPDGEASLCRRRGRGQTRQGASRPLASASEVPLGIHAAEASREHHKVSRGPARPPDLVTPLRLCPLAGSPPACSQAGTSPSCSCVCLPQSPQAEAPSHPTHLRCLLLPTAFFLTLSRCPRAGVELGGEAGLAG